MVKTEGLKKHTLLIQNLVEPSASSNQTSTVNSPVEMLLSG
jgi:hypothetical protein